MTSELREGLLGSSPAGETGAGEKDPSDEDDEFDDGRVASRGFGGFMRETGRIGLRRSSGTSAPKNWRRRRSPSRT
jgi:hypothetical protein